MALRFQKDDEVDRAAKEAAHPGVLVFVLAVFALVDGLFSWLRGESFASYGKNLAEFTAFGFAYWIVAPFYYEFRLRTEEVDGKVSAIEGAVKKIQEGQTELFERLRSVEEKLGAIQDQSL